MKRYLIANRPVAADIDSEPDGEDYLGRTVFEPEPQPIGTGLLDAQGVPIYAVHEPRPIGFRARIE